MTSEVHRSETHLTPARKNFMMLVMTSLLGVVSLGYVGAAIAYLLPRKGEGGKAQNLGAISKLPFKDGVAGPFVYDATGRGDAQGVYAVDLSGAGTKVDMVLEQTCRHLGCPVAWASPTFNCPCHGSVFAKNGSVVHGPAPTALYKHDFETKNGELIIKGRRPS